MANKIVIFLVFVAMVIALAVLGYYYQAANTALAAATAQAAASSATLATYQKQFPTNLKVTPKPGNNGSVSCNDFCTGLVGGKGTVNLGWGPAYPLGAMYTQDSSSKHFLSSNATPQTPIDCYCNSS